MRLIDAEHLMSEVEKLKESPWFNENINGARIVRREAINIVEDLCICQEPTVCDIDAIKAEINKQAWAIAISDTDRANGMWDAYRIIDKYKEKGTKNDI